MSQPLPQFVSSLAPSSQASSSPQLSRRVVMVTSPGAESTLTDVTTNLATVCAEVGQRVTLLSTSGLAASPEESEGPSPDDAWWSGWPSAGGETFSHDEPDGGLFSGPLDRDDVEDLLTDTDIPGVTRLDLRAFVGQPAQLVIRVPEVLAALRQVVDVVLLEVPSYLSVHHGEGLTPVVDVVLVVGERQTTTTEEMRKTSAALRRLSAPVVGMILTGGPETSFFSADSGLEESDEDLDERDTTQQIPVVESVSPLDDAYLTDEERGYEPEAVADNGYTARDGHEAGDERPPVDSYVTEEESAIEHPGPEA